MKNPQAYTKPTDTRDLRENGRVILAWGESTGHHHAVTYAQEALALPPLEYFEELDGRRVLLVAAPCLLPHQEHAPIALNPAAPQMFRQGDVYGLPLGIGAWEIRRQSEFDAGLVRSVAD